jgi:hypothetical protein
MYACPFYRVRFRSRVRVSSPIILDTEMRPVGYQYRLPFAENGL